MLKLCDIFADVCVQVLRHRNNSKQQQTTTTAAATGPKIAYEVQSMTIDGRKFNSISSRYVHT